MVNHQGPSSSPEPQRQLPNSTTLPATAISNPSGHQSLVVSLDPSIAGARQLTGAESTVLESAFTRYAALLTGNIDRRDHAASACAIVGFTTLLTDLRDGRAAYAHHLFDRKDVAALGQLSASLSKHHILAVAAKHSREVSPFDGWFEKTSTRCRTLELSPQAAIDLTIGLAIARLPAAASVLSGMRSVWEQCRPLCKAAGIVIGGAALTTVPGGTAIALAIAAVIIKRQRANKDVPTAAGLVGTYIVRSHREGALSCGKAKDACPNTLTNGWYYKAFRAEFAEWQICYSAGLSLLFASNLPGAGAVGRWIWGALTGGAGIGMLDGVRSRLAGTRERGTFESIVPPEVCALVMEVGARLDTYLDLRYEAK